MRFRAFTIVEIMVVLFIVAILAAIALPRIPESRAVGRRSEIVKDMKSIAAALVAYKADHNSFPAPTPYTLSSKDATRLHTKSGLPIRLPAFIWDKPKMDLFMKDKSQPFRYAADADGFILASAGPDEDWDLDVTHFRGSVKPEDSTLLPYTYDPTNGTFSPGDLIHISN